VLALPVLLVLSACGMARRRRPGTDGPFTDVPDAPPGAAPVEAPGMTYPYSSLDPPYSGLDPWAPPKRPVSVAPGDDAGPRSEERDRP
jgi:hypothetical protein